MVSCFSTHQAAAASKATRTAQTVAGREGQSKAGACGLSNPNKHDSRASGG
jgi:hypothetical protein